MSGPTSPRFANVSGTTHCPFCCNDGWVLVGFSRGYRRDGAVPALRARARDRVPEVRERAVGDGRVLARSADDRDREDLHAPRVEQLEFVRCARTETVVTAPLWSRWIDCVTAPECPASSGARHVAHALTRYMDRDGECFPSLATLAGRTSLAQSTVKLKLNELRRLDLLAWKMGYGKSSNRYQALLPNVERAERRPTDEPEVADSVPLVGRMSPRSGPTVGPELGELGELRPEGPHEAAPSGRDDISPSPETPGGTPVSRELGEPADDREPLTEGEVDGGPLVDPEAFLTEIVNPKTKELPPAPEGALCSDCGKAAKVMIGPSAVCRSCGQRRLAVGETRNGSVDRHA